MALAVDSEMAANAGAGAVDPASPWTFSFTNTAGTVLYLIVGYGVGGAATAITFGTVTYGGASMTKIVEQTTSGSTTGGKIAVFRLLSPATGANTISVGFTGGGGSVDEMWGGCISFTGNNTTTPEAQSTSSHGTSSTASVALTGVVAGNISIGGAGAGTSMSAQTQTLSWAKNVDNNTAMGNGRSSRSASSGAVTHSFTIGGSDSWATVAIEVAAASGGGTNNTLTAPAGVLTLAADAPTISSGNTQTAPAGALTLGADAPTLLSGTVLTAPAGVLTLAADAPTLSEGNTQTAPAGALVLGADAPTIGFDTTLTAAVGTLTLAGLAATINNGSGTTTFDNPDDPWIVYYHYH